MITVKFYGVKPASKYEDRISDLPEAGFSKIEEDIGKIKSSLETYDIYSKIIVVGSFKLTSSFKLYLRALKGNGKKVFVLNYGDPDLIVNLKKDYTTIDTLVIYISGSGDTTSNIKLLFQFREYKIIIVADSSDTPIRSIANYYKWKLVERILSEDEYSSFTAASLAPAELFGLPIDRIAQGAKSMYKRCSPRSLPENNIAWQIASGLYMAGLVGKNQFRLLPKSYYLETVDTLIEQLTNTIAINKINHSKLVDGLDNEVSIVIRPRAFRNNGINNEIPKELQDIDVGDGKLSDINGVSLAEVETLKFDRDLLILENSKKPYILIEIAKIDSENISELIALWQYVTYYLSALLAEIQ